MTVKADIKALNMQEEAAKAPAKAPNLAEAEHNPTAKQRTLGPNVSTETSQIICQAPVIRKLAN